MTYSPWAKGQLISKANCQAEDSSKKRMNEFASTSMRRVFICFLEESSAIKKRFEIIWPLPSTFIENILSLPCDPKYPHYIVHVKILQHSYKHPYI